MKKQQLKIIALAFGFGAFIGLTDTLLDYFFFYEGSFTGLMISNVPAHEVYIRLLIMICFLCFGFIASNLITRLKDKEEKQAELISRLQTAILEIRALKGILPICSYCKKIRDDKGYWNQVEVYIKEHSGADFSHSICPECAEEHFLNVM